MLRRFTAQPTSFVGRTRELEEIAARLSNPDCRLLTLTGAGGSGKTRLAAEACRLAASGFVDGAVFVALQPIERAERLIPAIAHAAGFSFYRKDDLQTQLLNYLHETHLLLLLDNFEHLLDGVELVTAILATAPRVKIVITSREPLNLKEEWLYPVSGMSIPPSTYSDDLEDYESVQLFLYLARRVQPDFSLADAREDVVRICQVADGLPLAIELAAAWLKGLPVVDIAREMQHNFGFLETSMRNVEERHRSIRAAFDQSWKLLNDRERETFARLSIFRGGFAREAAEQAAGASLTDLAGLVEKSLLNKQQGDRWDVHELLRQYGEEKLAEMGLRDAARTAHSRYYAAFMGRCDSAIRSPAQLDILADIERDFENISSAWGWAIQTGQDDVLDRILNSLYQFGFFCSRYRETLDMFDLALDRTHDQRLRGRLLARRWGYVHWLSVFDHDSAFQNIQQAIDIATASGDRFEIAFSKLMMGYVWLNKDENARARDVLNESLALFAELDDPFYESWVMHRIGYSYFNDEDIDRALDWTEKSLALGRTAPNQNAVGNCLYNLAGQYVMNGDYERGTRYAEEALQVTRTLGHPGQLSHSLAVLSLARFMNGDFEEAGRLAREGLAAGDGVCAPVFQCYPLSMMVMVTCLNEDYREAARLISTASTQGADSMIRQLLGWSRAVLASGLGDRAAARDALGEALPGALAEGCRAVLISLLPSAAFVLADEQPAQAIRLLGWLDHSGEAAARWPRRWPLVERLGEDLRHRLGETAFRAECERGAEMPWEQALAALVAGFADSVPDLRGLPDGEQLTQRELEVLHLLARGLTNLEIAENLVIGLGTVKTHTKNIYSKLDVDSRTRAILRGQELGLLP